MTTSPQDQNRAARYQRQQMQRRRSIQKIHNSSSYAGPEYIIAFSLGLMGVIAFFASMLHAKMAVEAFVVQPLFTRHHSSSTKIFLEDWVAEMIDNELYRQQHHKEYEAAWMEKNKGAVINSLSDDKTNIGVYPSQMMNLDDREAFAEHKRDERMAFLKPEKYCADRCLATGNCDILEDFYELGPEDVVKFCEECVLGGDSDVSLGCDVPEAFYEKEPPLRP
mmetsp:Transcript_159/g.359  ORF Transcript_159/g.359 Transcript_159/m.359 type:complete len:222 (-) Transcript_159:355-1020(-)